MRKYLGIAHVAITEIINDAITSIRIIVLTILIMLCLFPILKKFTIIILKIKTKNNKKKNIIFLPNEARAGKFEQNCDYTK